MFEYLEEDEFCYSIYAIICNSFPMNDTFRELDGGLPTV